MSNNNNYRYIARITIEADTPLKIGTGKSGLLTDEIVATDAYGFPYIPGTAITGVIKHSLSDKWIDDILGCHNNQDKEKSTGSRLIVSSASMIGCDGKTIEGPISNDDENTAFYNHFNILPVRDHVKITHKGTSNNKGFGKFDKQVIYKGCRFVFELELIGDEKDNDKWNTLLDTISSPDFRLGGGTRKGFGKLKVIDNLSNQIILDLKNDAELEQYLNKDASFNTPLNGEPIAAESKSSNNIHYKLKLEPEDYFIFSSGNPEAEIDSVAKKEKIIKWKKGEEKGKEKGQFSEEKILIPATSVKGAIAHRVAYHYNLLENNYADGKSEEELKELTGQNNVAVKELFGCKANENENSNKNKETIKEPADSNTNENEINKGRRGRVVFSDIYIKEKSNKLFNHVAIDRFTGGAIDGALFNEEVIKTDEFELDIIVEPLPNNTNINISKAFEYALLDICDGMLPLGGSVMRGHGSFTGECLKNEEELKREEIHHV
jgi:CRISPR/Cas system CSM-associated protein Csm3 (group 7 of RAMP superfamily)